MTILLTGVTGLVGARLAPRLVAAGEDCRALVRGGKGVPPGVTAVEGDLFDPASLARAVDGVSAVVHLAAVFRTQDEGLIWRSNLDGTQTLIAAVKAHGPTQRFILASTSNVYSRDSPHPGREDDPVDPPQAYPASKVAAEAALRNSGLRWAVLRLPFVYGEGDGHLEMLPKHVVAGDWHPAQRMSTLHHLDVATAMTLALEGAMDGRIVNISDDAPTSVYELAELAGQKMQPSSDSLECPWYQHVDASLARTLGFQPKVRTVYQAVQGQML